MPTKQEVLTAMITAYNKKAVDDVMLTGDNVEIKADGVNLNKAIELLSKYTNENGIRIFEALAQTNAGNPARDGQVYMNYLVQAILAAVAEGVAGFLPNK